jgi:4'-phosphopantetheinyl transferase
VYNPFGKPDLSPELGGRLRFNLSHSAGLALIAVAADSNVGVDLEQMGAQPEFAEIAGCFFSAPEVEQLNALPSHLYTERFLCCWTKKEAFVKARGEGLAIRLDSFSVPVANDSSDVPMELCVPSNDALPAKRWTLHTLRPAPDYVAGGHRGKRLAVARMALPMPEVKPSA